MVNKEYKSPLTTFEINPYKVCGIAELIHIDVEDFWGIKDQMFAEWMGWTEL